MRRQDRLVKLEASSDALARRCEELERRAARLERLEYDAEDDEFFPDRGCIDWLVWEPVDTAHVTYHARPSEPMTAAHMDAPVRLPRVVSASGSVDCNDFIDIHVPVERSCRVFRTLRLSRRITVRELLRAIENVFAVVKGAFRRMDVSVDIETRIKESIQTVHSSGLRNTFESCWSVASDDRYSSARA